MWISFHLCGGAAAEDRIVAGGRRILGNEDGRQPDEGEDFRDVRGDVADGKRVAGVKRVGVESDESGDAGSIDAFNSGEIECDALAAHEGGEERDEALIGATHQFGNAGRLDDEHLFCQAGICVHKNLQFIPASQVANKAAGQAVYLSCMREAKVASRGNMLIAGGIAG